MSCADADEADVWAIGQDVPDERGIEPLAAAPALGASSAGPIAAEHLGR